MPTIKVQVRDKVALNTTPQEQIVCHNSDYKVEFDFDGDWNNYITKTAYFVYNDKYVAVPFNGNVCEVPVLSDTTVCKIGVQAGDIRTTTSAYVQCKKSIVDEGGETPKPPTESVYNKIVDLVNGISVQVDNLGATVELSVDNDYILTIALKNADGDILSQSSVDLPIESLVVSAKYDTEQKAIIFTLQSGETLVVPIGDIVGDVVSSVEFGEFKENTNKAINAINEKITQLGGGLTESEVKEIVQETAVTQESDPTVPNWAKQPQKPSYTAQEVGALPSDTPLFSGNYNDLTNKPEGLASEEYVDKKAETTLESANSYTDKKLSEVELTKVVDILPIAPEVGDQNKLFLVAKTLGEANDLFDEYIWVNGFWEYQGTKKFDVDLSDYQKKTDETLETTAKKVAGAINEVNEKADSNANSLTALVESLAELMPEVVRVY